MRSKSTYLLVASVSCLALAGCASDGTSMLTTASVEQKKPAVAAVDPACVELQNRIAVLRAEGTVGRVEQAAVGKTKTVVIKRESLGKVAELNKANAEFQLRCSKLTTTAAVQPSTNAQVAGAQSTAAAQKN